jgi:GNAT superfamily N-acetyltransferase
VRLREISADRYAREILPQTAPLWAGGRSFDDYAAQTLEIARGAYGRRSYRTIGLFEQRRCVATFKHYDRTMRHNGKRLRAIGLGAVFTPPEQRGRGYASVMVAMALDRAHRDRYDLAYLFSDIRPQFYAAIGFRTLPSRRFSVRADLLPSARLDLTTPGDDWKDVRRLYDRMERRAVLGFARSAPVWEWIRTCARQGAAYRSGYETNLIARHRGRAAAYILGVRDPEKDVYVVREFGFDRSGERIIGPLLRAAAGDLRRLSGWLPPSGAREILPKPAVGARKHSIFMMAPLSREGEAALDAALAERAEVAWSSDHV